MTFKEKMKGMLASMGIDVSKVPDEAFPEGGGSTGGAFTEADMEAAKRKAADEAARKEREKLTAEYAEKDRKARQDARKKEISAWCESMVKNGKLTPSMVKFGVPEMLQSFAEQEVVIEFGEDKTKATLYDRFKTLFEEEVPKLVTFGEIAKRGDGSMAGATAGAKLEKLVKDKMKENKELTYAEAFSEVQQEHSDLAAEYANEMKGE